MNVENDPNTQFQTSSLPQQDNRLHEIFDRLMTLTFHIGIERFTLRQFVLNNDLKLRVFKEISHQSRVNLLNGSKQALYEIKSAASKVTPQEIYKRHRLVVNLTVIGNLTTSASKVVKIFMLDSKIKEINSIVKFVKKAVYFRNGGWDIQVRSLANPETFHKLLRLVYNTLYILSRSIEIGTDNTLIKTAFAAVEHTTELEIFLRVTSPFVSYLTVCMNPIKLISKTSRLYITYSEWSKLEYDDLPETKKIKRLELGKSILDTSLIGIRFALVTAGLPAAAQSLLTATAVLSIARASMSIATYIKKQNAAAGMNSFASECQAAPAG